jgi:hypothetical protein
MPHFLAIIPSKWRDQANRDAALWDSDDLTDHWYAPLNADGSPRTRPSHYWGSRELPDAQYAILERLMATYDGGKLVLWDKSTDPGLPNRLLTEMRLQRIQPEE